MEQATIAFIGAGNMGGSLIGGLIADGYAANLLWASNPSPEKLEQLKTRFNVHTTNSNIDAIKKADVVVLAVKPQVLSEVAAEIKTVIQERKPLVVSIAAGIRITDLDKWLGGDVAIVRAMPNTPAMVGSGASGLFSNDLVSEKQKNLAESILRAVGITVWLEKENQIDIVTALSASGPAYIFLIMEGLAQAAEKQGLEKDDAKLLTTQMVLGAAHIAMKAGVDFDVLREQVTSPGGTTEAALKVLMDADVRKVFSDALEAARERAIELAELS